MGPVLEPVLEPVWGPVLEPVLEPEWGVVWEIAFQRTEWDVGLEVLWGDERGQA